MQVIFLLSCNGHRDFSFPSLAFLFKTFRKHFFKGVNFIYSCGIWEETAHSMTLSQTPPPPTGPPEPVIESQDYSEVSLISSGAWGSLVSSFSGILLLFEGCRKRLGTVSFPTSSCCTLLCAWSSKGSSFWGHMPVLAVPPGSQFAVGTHSPSSPLGHKSWNHVCLVHCYWVTLARCPTQKPLGRCQ